MALKVPPVIEEDHAVQLDPLTNAELCILPENLTKHRAKTPKRRLPTRKRKQMVETEEEEKASSPKKMPKKTGKARLEEEATPKKYEERVHVLSDGPEEHSSKAPLPTLTKGRARGQRGRRRPSRASMARAGEHDITVEQEDDPTLTLEAVCRLQPPLENLTKYKPKTPKRRPPSKNNKVIRRPKDNFLDDIFEKEDLDLEERKTNETNAKKTLKLIKKNDDGVAPPLPVAQVSAKENVAELLATSNLVAPDEETEPAKEDDENASKVIEVIIFLEQLLFRGH